MIVLTADGERALLLAGQENLQRQDRSSRDQALYLETYVRKYGGVRKAILPWPLTASPTDEYGSAMNNYETYCDRLRSRIVAANWPQLFRIVVEIAR